MLSMMTTPSPNLVMRRPNILLMSVIHLIAILAVTAVVAALQIHMNL